MLFKINLKSKFKLKLKKSKKKGQKIIRSANKLNKINQISFNKQINR